MSDPHAGEVNIHIPENEIQLDPNKKVQSGEIIVPLTPEQEEALKNGATLKVDDEFEGVPEVSQMAELDPNYQSRRTYKRLKRMYGKQPKEVKPTTKADRLKRKKQRQNRKKGRR